MKVIIVSKTRMSKNSCVGGLTYNGHFIRLLTSEGQNQPLNTEYDILDIWDLEFEKKHFLRNPHVEDVIVQSSRKLGHLRKSLTLKNVLDRLNIQIWKGSLDELFDGLLNWTSSGSGYISEEKGVPCQSVGFWLPDNRLKKKVFYEKVRYEYPNIYGWRSIPYVGFEEPVDIIPRETLVRVSLARWFDKDGETEERCYLQLSGWYDLSIPDQSRSDQVLEDLPF